MSACRDWVDKQEILQFPTMEFNFPPWHIMSHHGISNPTVGYHIPPWHDHMLLTALEHAQFQYSPKSQKVTPSSPHISGNNSQKPTPAHPTYTFSEDEDSNGRYCVHQAFKTHSFPKGAHFAPPNLWKNILIPTPISTSSNEMR